MANILLARLIRRVGAETTWWRACVGTTWLNEHEQAGTQRVTRTQHATAAAAKRAFEQAIAARLEQGFVEHQPIGVPGWAIDGNGKRAYWYVGKAKSWFGKGERWGDEVELVTHAIAKPASKPASKPAKKPAKRPAKPSSAKRRAAR